ncbi:MAG: NAD(P)H-dependent oxidoreductase, partial [Hyphomicrobiales bacterium]|nr:NAD(P)H-dependent oxidoreductase [Hyphomicrobiales bacterium]
MATLNVVSICGSLRKGSFNAMVQRLLPSLAPDGMTVKPAPSFADFPLYNADIQNSSGFPAPVNTLADAIRAADGVIFCTPEYNFSVPGGLKNAIDWVSRLANQPFAGK